MIREGFRGVFALMFGLVLLLLLIHYPNLVVQLIDLFWNTAYNIARAIGENVHVH